MNGAGVHTYLDDDHESLRAMVRDFADREIEPHAEQWDRDHEFPVDVVLRMGEAGLFGIPFPEPYGGGGDLRGLCVAIEELAYSDQALAITLEAAVGLGASPILKFGTPAQRDEWLPDLCAGRTLGAFGLTEPDAGSDAAGTRTTATLNEGVGTWILNGEKSFITNSGTPITTVITVTARTGDDEISTVLVPAGTPGLDVLPPYRKMGWHASDTHGLAFTDCEVPAANLLGVRGRGVAQFLEVLDEGRVAIAALALGVIRRCRDDSIEYANQRRAFGRPIGSNQGVAFPIADLEVAYSAGRELVYRAASMRDAGLPFSRDASIAKLYATEAAVSATRSATQVFGGTGFMDETPVARHYRDAKILEIGEGTSEVQRLIIARSLGLPVR